MLFLHDDFGLVGHKDVGAALSMDRGVCGLLEYL